MPVLLLILDKRHFALFLFKIIALGLLTTSFAITVKFLEPLVPQPMHTTPFRAPGWCYGSGGKDPRAAPGGKHQKFPIPASFD